MQQCSPVQGKISFLLHQYEAVDVHDDAKPHLLSANVLKSTLQNAGLPTKFYTVEKRTTLHLRQKCRFHMKPLGL